MEKYSNILVLTSLFLAAALLNIDFTSVSLMIPTLSTDFKIKITDVQFMYNLYFFSASAFFITAGKLVDIYSDRKIFLIGMSIFMLCSFSFAVLSQFKYFYIIRAIQGIGYAFVYPTTVLVANRILPSHLKFSGIGLVLTTSTIFQAIGPSIGGILIDSWGWRSVFYINAAISLLSLLGFTGYKPRILEKPQSKSFDLRGAIVFYFIFALLTFLATNTVIPFLLKPIILLLAGVIIYLIYKLNNKVKFNFFDLNIFKNKSFSKSLALRFLFSVCWIIIIVYMPTYLQNTIKLSATDTGLVMLVFTVISAVITAFSGRIINRTSTKKVLTFGFLIIILMYIACAPFLSDPSILTLAFMLAVYGVATGLIVPAITKMTVEALDERSKGQGLGIFYTVSLLAMGLGTTILSFTMKLVFQKNTTWVPLSAICCLFIIISLCITLIKNEQFLGHQAENNISNV